MTKPCPDAKHLLLPSDIFWPDQTLPFVGHVTLSLIDRCKHDGSVTRTRVACYRWGSLTTKWRIWAWQTSAWSMILPPLPAVEPCSDVAASLHLLSRDRVMLQWEQSACARSSPCLWCCAVTCPTGRAPTLLTAPAPKFVNSFRKPLRPQITRSSGPRAP